MNESVPIVFLTDNNYVIPTGVAVKSLIDSYKGGLPLKIFIIVADVSEENKNLFLKFNSNEVSIELIEIDNEFVQKFTESTYYVTATGLLKFCIPRLLPQYDKILYIDGDILVKKDLSPLMAVDVEGYYAAAVADMKAMVSLNFHKRLKRMRYFNSGVLLLNGAKLRKDDVEKKLFDTKLLHPEYQCMDQDVFNDVFNDRVKYLSPIWNCMTYNLINDRYSMNEINIFYNTNFQNINEMEEAAAIVHLTNEFKPWLYKDAYMHSEWMEVFNTTPFNSVKLKFSEAVSDYRDDKYTIIKKGIFTKYLSPEHSYVTLGKTKFLEKIKGGSTQGWYLFRLPLVKCKKNTAYIKKYILGIRVRKHINYEVIKSEIDRYFGQLNSVIDNILVSNNQVDSDSEYGSYFECQNLIRQLDILDSEEK